MDMGYLMGSSNHTRQPRRSGPGSRRRLRAGLVGLLSVVLAVTGLGALVSPAMAATVYEIEGDWAPGTPKRRQG